MSDAKFTPGPWNITTCVDYWISTEEFGPIAHCGDISWLDYETKQRTWEANARLMAASPDMYELLKTIQGWVAMDSSETWDQLLLTKGINNVLAKAEGES